MNVLVTGASGFIGSHVVEALLGGGHHVTALLRAGSTRSPPSGAGVRAVVGDVTDLTSLVRACRNQDCVVHAAGLVGDGRRGVQFDAVVFRGTANLVQAATATRLRRLIHVSSIAVYDTRHRMLAESTPLARSVPRWNHYVRTKVAAEDLLWRAHRAGAIGLTSLRPSITLGPRDRFTTPRVLRLVGSRAATLVGDPDTPVPCVVVEEVAAAVARAAVNPAAEGRAYNLSGRGRITQRELLRLHAEAASLPPPARRVPRPAAMAAAALSETWARLAGGSRGPVLSRFVVWAATAGCDVDTSRAAAELGWEGSDMYASAVQRAVRWLEEGEESCVS